MSLVRSADHRYRLGDGPCRVPDCTASADVPGTARGYCIRHYNRWRRNGMCEALRGCQRPATSHLGLCEAHTPEGIPA